MAMDDLDMNQSGLDTDTILSYAKDRYEEAKISYKRLEDKANFLLAFLGLETSALLAVFSLADVAIYIKYSIFVKLSVALFLLCLTCIVMCFFHLWKSWVLKNVPRMPIHDKEKQHNHLLTGDAREIIRYYLVAYAKATRLIEGLHREKAEHINKLFLWLALSFVYFTLSIIFILISKV